MPPNDTLWHLEEHTKGKHAVLEKYLGAWLPILGTTNGRIVFIDGFAGPGEYLGGERGSPWIALNAFGSHPAAQRVRDIQFLFIEERQDRANHLKQLLGRLFPQMPPNARYQVTAGTCAPLVTGLLDILEARGDRLAPSFMMLDPFGVHGLSMSLIERFFRHSSAEVYISLMYEPIRRFYETPEFAPHLDELFGTPEWRTTMAMPNLEEARLATYRLYDQQLRDAGATYVLHFDLYKGGRLIYSIFFATKHLLGCDRMKQAIWSVMPGGDYRFRGARHAEQLTLDLPANPSAERLHADLLRIVDTAASVPVEAVQAFISSDESPFHTSNFKPGLKELEQRGIIAVQRRPNGRAGTFPPGTLISRAAIANRL